MLKGILLSEGYKEKSLKDILESKYRIDDDLQKFTWTRNQIKDLLQKLSASFMQNYRNGYVLSEYFTCPMGTITIAIDGNSSAIVDGCKRITALSLLLIYLLHKYENTPGFPKKELENLIDFWFCHDQNEFIECMFSLYCTGTYILKDTDDLYIQNTVNRYSDFSDCWDDSISNENIVLYTHWLIERVYFCVRCITPKDYAWDLIGTKKERADLRKKFSDEQILDKGICV